MVLANLFFSIQMAIAGTQLSKVYSKIIYYKAKEEWSLMMAASTKACLKITKCMERVYFIVLLAKPKENNFGIKANQT